MSSALRSHVLELRKQRGWSQSHLGELAGISRQGLAAIEAGQAVPSTEIALRLARAFSVPLEDLFQLADESLESEVVESSGLGVVHGGRVRIASLGGRRLAYGLGSEHFEGSPLADGEGELLPDGRVRVRPLPAAPPPPHLVVAGCDPAFGVIKERLRREHGVEVLWCSAGSRAALNALARGAIHVAGMHLQDPETETYNGPFVRRAVPFPTTRISFAVWQQALLLESGNPLGVRGVEDLARPGIRFVNREPGSGSRTLIERQLAKLSISDTEVPGFLETSAAGHHEIGSTIAAGAANAGVAIQAAGTSRQLSIVPLAEEPYELVVPDHFLELPAVEALLAILRRPETKRQVEALGGYDAAAMGNPA